MSLEHIENKDVSGQSTGFSTNARFAPVRWFKYMAQPVDGVVNALHVLHEGYEFLNCYVLPDSIDGAANSFGDKAAMNKKYTPEFFIPGESEQLHHLIDTIRNEPLILLLDDGEQSLQFGNDKVACYMNSCRFTSGTAFEGKKGYEVKSASVNRYFYNDDATLKEIIVSHCNAFGYPVDEDEIEETAYYDIDPIARDKADLLLIPLAYATGIVYAIDKLLFTYPVSFSRASQATRYDKDGIPELVATHKPRLTHDPNTKAVSYMCEPASTNVITKSETPNTAVVSTFWGNYGCNMSGAITGSHGPFVELTLTENLGLSDNRVLYGNGGIVGSNPQTNTITFQAKANGRHRIMLINQVFVDLNNGNKSGNGQATVRDVGDGWYEITSTWTVGSADVYWIVWVVDEFNYANPYYEGDGVSGVKIRMMQNERSHFGTSYIPTSGSQATRVAEAYNYSALQAKQQQSNDKGSFFIDTKRISAINGNTEFGLQFLKGAGLDDEHFAFSLSKNSWTHQYYIGGAATNTLSNTGTAEKVANQFSAGALKQYQNGIRVLDVAYGGTMYLSGFKIGAPNSGFDIYTVAFFKDSLLNAELSQLTT